MDDNNGNKHVKKLHQLLIKEFKAEVMHGENQVYCAQCQKKTNSTKKISLLTHPQYLNITIKMFNAMGEKLPRLVAVPLHLNLISSGVIDANYMLVSVIIHSGPNAHQGHYKQVGRSIADAQNAWQRKKSHSSSWEGYGNWIYCNDEIKRPTTLQDVKSILGLGRTKNSFECAYNVTYIRMEQVHGIAIPKMPNIPLYNNEAEYDDVTLDDWNGDGMMNQIQSDDEDDWNMVNTTDCNKQKTMEIDDDGPNLEEEDVSMVQSTILSLPRL